MELETGEGLEDRSTQATEVSEKVLGMLKQFQRRHYGSSFNRFHSNKHAALQKRISHTG